MQSRGATMERGGGKSCTRVDGADAGPGSSITYFRTAHVVLNAKKDLGEDCGEDTMQGGERRAGFMQCFSASLVASPPCQHLHQNGETEHLSTRPGTTVGHSSTRTGVMQRTANPTPRNEIDRTASLARVLL